MTLLASRSQLRASFLRWVLFLVPTIVLLGFLSGQVSGSGEGNPWFAALTKPDWNPPGRLFPIVWTALYVMMGLSLAMVCAAWGARGRGLAIGLFALQFVLNLAWSPVFFGMREIAAGLGVIIALDLALIATIAVFWRVRKNAALLLLPYLGWVLFATFLNFTILQLNPDGGPKDAAGAASQRVTL